MPLHHLMIGTWTPPGAIFTVQFDDEKLELSLLKRTEIPHDEPISWMAFDVSWLRILILTLTLTPDPACVGPAHTFGASTPNGTSTVPP